MSRASRWTSVARAGEVRLELAPAGLRGFYRTALTAVIVIGSMALPLGLVGLFGGLFWGDFPTALRLVMGVVGGAVVVASLWLPAWLILDATTLRARVRVLPGGVFVELGRVSPSRALWLAPRDGVKVEAGSHAELGRGGAVSNVAWFWLTIGLLALQPLLTIGPAIAREL